MQTLQRFLSETWQYTQQMLILAIPAGVIFCCFLPYRRRALAAQKLQSGALRELALLTFVMTLAGILAVTLEPGIQWSEDAGLWGNLTLLIARPDPLANVNLQPFYMLRIFRNCVNLGAFVYILINFVGNMWVFVPVGFFPALLFRNGRWWRSAGFGALLSTLIECGQYFIMRNTDIDDVILNTLGALIGYWLYLLLKKAAPNLCGKFQCKAL